ncbi:Pycsar system effector family protein [Streptosporangium carneum]|uniref:NUDIX hydrolase n=1 Tax=Streptosporangium carneum TaxID=47481 RepID=A0A9W6HVD9_9ACTN|nr:Pycsar system effector family protein [Streptosporangium carneum]GLK06738.1 hypothetical protein GCM10017600_01430 [Streptosporangium carneum]
MHITAANGTTPAPATTSLTACEHRSVGVIVQDAAGQYLMFEQATAPGIAPPAGHLAPYGEPEQAARALVAEQTGLIVGHLTPVTAGWRPGRYDRCTGVDRSGHYWHLFQTTLTGEVAPSVRAAGRPRWLMAHQVQALAYRTVDHAHGLITDEQFAACPGLAPVWVDLLATAHVIVIDDLDLALVEDLATRPPLTPASETPTQAVPVAVSGTVRARPDRLDEHGAAELLAETEAVRTELARTDAKAATVLAFAGTAFSVLAALSVLAPELAVPARVGLAGAVALLGASSAVALGVIRPSLPRSGPGTGFVAHAAVRDAEELLAVLADDPQARRARDIVHLSRTARAKYRRLRLAIDLAFAALAALAVAAVFAL